jgi:long-chain acyl-CoA synthetase
MVSKNFNSVLLNNLARHADSPALMFKDRGTYRTVTYNSLEEICIRVASGLMKMGLEQGDRIVIVSNNRPEWAYADLGSILAGAIASAIYVSALSDEIEFIIRDLEAAYVFVENEDLLTKISQIRDAIPTVRKVFIFAENYESSDPWIAPFSQLMETGDKTAASVTKIRDIANTIKGEDIMCIIYTSGTTGKPKGVVLTHNNYINTSEILLEHIGETEKLKRNLSFLPLAHAFERFAGHYLILYMGKCIAYVESLEKIMDNFREVKPNIVVSVPRFFENVHRRIIQGVESATPIKRKLFFWALAVGYAASSYKIDGRALPPTLKVKQAIADFLVFRKVRKAFGGELEFFASGGAPLSKKLAEFFYSMGILILEGWGATEATTPSTFNSPYEFRFGSVGKPLPRVRVRLGPDDELEVKGPNVFKEYWKNPEETDDTFTPDGFYRTGDIGYIDKDGWVSIIDRKKQLIITSGGKNIAPAPIEQLLANSRSIEMAYVHGDRQNYLTALLVVNQYDIHESARKFGVQDIPWPQLVEHPRITEEIQKELDQVNKQLPQFMQVRDFRILHEPFSVEGGEMTHTLKLKRKVIREKYGELLNTMYA